MTEPSGLAPVVDPEPLAETALCRHCAELIRYWPCAGQHHAAEPWPLTADPEVAGLCRYCLAAPEHHHEQRACTADRWRHVVARPHDHEPLPMTESEARAMWGDR